jgi:hypothetical protein
MGILNFMKKKDDSSLSIPPDFDLAKMESDLPPISANPDINPDIKSDANPEVSEDDFMSLPPLAMPESPEPSLPPPDLSFGSAGDLPGYQDPSLFDQSTARSSSISDSSMDDDLNHLFLADDTWKEPDWNNYEPYQEAKIDAPTAEDFGGTIENSIEAMDEGMDEGDGGVDFNIDRAFASDMKSAPRVSPDVRSPDLQSFDVDNPKQESQQLESFTDIEEKPASREEAPIEVYVKGSDYRNVYEEMVRIDELLGMQEPKITALEESAKQEDEMLSNAREKMEYIQKKLMIVDRRIFG